MAKKVSTVLAKAKDLLESEKINVGVLVAKAQERWAAAQKKAALV